MVLHQDHSRDAARRVLHTRKLTADGERQICAGIRIRHPAPAVIRTGERLFRDLAAGGRAAGEVRVDAVRVADKFAQDRMEARLHGRTQRGQALDLLCVFPGKGRALLLHVCKLL